MNANASLGTLRRSGVSDDITPVVVIDGVPEPRMAVESFAVSGPLDIRSAMLFVDAPDGSPGVFAHWLSAPAVVAVPMRLSDGTLKWHVLAQGSLREVTDEVAAGRAGRFFHLIDAWSQTLSGPTQSIWWRNPNGALVAQLDGTLEIGDQANRSSGTHTVNGRQVYVLERGSGLRWSIGEVLATTSAFADLGLSLPGLPRDVANAELIRPIDLTRPLSATLESILDDYSLTLRRDITREDGVIIERGAVRPPSGGRPIHVLWADGAQPIGDALRVEVDQPAQAARQWVARADGWRVESTFELVGGWDPALQGQADSEYDKLDSSDFATFANVYRRWVLNEDGLFTAPPYNRGPAFDLTTLFGMGDVDPRPLVFASNLTLDDDGSPIKPIVEMSTNSGADWSLFPAATDMLDNRAGVYLDPTTLPAAFLSAAKAGTARIRVTASLQSPLPMDLVRWHGNASAPSLPPLVLDVSDAFTFKRVDEQSIHHAAVASGALSTDESDDTFPMHRWLVDRITRHAQAAPNGGKAALELTGTWPELCPGDRLMNVRGPGVAADGWPQAVSSLGAKVQSVQTRFAHSSGKGRTTTVKLIF